MPPLRYKAPLPVRFKVPKGIINPLEGPDIVMGKSVIAAAPYCVTADQIEIGRRVIRRFITRRKEFMINIHATYAVTKKPAGVKMGQGKGDIDHFVARVPAGRAMFTIPQITPIPGMQFNFSAFKQIGDKLPMPVRFRDQNNHFDLSNDTKTKR